MNKEKFINKLNEELEELKGKELLYFNMRDSVQEARCTNRIFGIQYALNFARLLEEPQKVKVPAFVAGWIELCKEKADASSCLNGYYETGNGTIVRPRGFSEEFYDWLTDCDHMDDLARAWLDGYEVEEEPLYYVRLPYEVWDEEAAELKTGYFYLHYGITSDETRIFPTKEPRRGFSTKLDELTIKSADENYWPFAVPVEQEVAE